MKALKLIIKVLIAAITLWFIRDKFDTNQFRKALVNPVMLFIAPVCWLTNQFLTALRLHSVLQVLERPSKLADVIRANMSSLFVGNLMPGVVGADVVKFFYIKRNDPTISNMQLAIVLALDRMLGLFAVLFWAAVFSVFVPTTHASTDPRLVHALMFLPISLLAALVLGLVVLEWGMKLISNARLPSFMKNFVETYKIFRKTVKRSTLWLAMIYNLSAVFVLLGGLVWVGTQFQIQSGQPTTVAIQFFLIPISIIASMIPLTPMGIGVAQVSMSAAYSLFGLDSNLGVSISTFSQLGLLFVSVVVGGGLFLLRGRQSRVAETAREANLQLPR